MKRILLTGGTGFVGRFLAYRLLQEGNYIFFLARSKKEKSARERVEEALSFVGPISQYRERIDIIKGDITQKNLGIVDDEIRMIDEVWHCAASTKFETSESELIRKINVDGTRNLLNFMTTKKITRLHHLSSAYVAREIFRNPYEQTKFEAENLVNQWAQKTSSDFSIYRLSIVIGDSATGKTPTFTGYYGYFTPFWFWKNYIAKRIENGFSAYTNAGIKLDNNNKLTLPIVIRRSPISSLNLIPIDWIVKTLIALSQKTQSIGKTFHLVHPNPPRVEWVIDTSLRILGIRNFKVINNGCEINHSDSTLQKVQKGIDEIIDQYLPYVTSEPYFDITNLQRVLGSDYVSPPPINEELLKVILDYAVKNNFGLRKDIKVQKQTTQFAAA